MKAVVLIVFAILLLTPVKAMSPRRSPDTGMVRILYIGYRGLGFSPFPYMVEDPFLEMTPVRASRVVDESDVIRRSIRVYIPRTTRP